VSSMWRWGVLGCADIAVRAMIPAIQQAREAKLEAVASRDANRGEAVALRFGVRALPSYEALLSDPAVDVVYVPLPTGLHAEWVLAALAAGKHVLCEKPLATTAADVDRICTAAEAKGLVAMEALMYRLHPLAERAVDLVRSGLLGEPQVFTASFTYHLADAGDIRFRRDLGGGVLLDVGSYCVSTARLLIGNEPSEVHGFARFGPRGDADEAFTGALRFADGALATFACACTAPRDQWYRLACSDATLAVANPYAPGTDDRDLLVVRGFQRGAQTEERITVPGADQYRLLVEHVGDVVAGRDSPRVGLAETRANVAAVEALMASAREGGPRRLHVDR